MDLLEQLAETTAYLQDRGITEPEVGIVLGTGLGKMVDHIAVDVALSYEDIPHFPVATVEFHSGKLIYGRLDGRQVLAMQGRFHYYEGYSMQQVTFPIRVMQRLGVQQLLLSNAAGAMNTAFQKGDLMLINDHINLLPTNPLIGPNHEALGPRFPDMSEAYARDLNRLFREAASELDLKLHDGVYVSVPGPNLETAAENRYLHRIWADAVGMSTV
ncbi:MAG: purine-nucleoside phosphorylase, partial [Bacteroidota bacterium]